MRTVSKPARLYTTVNLLDKITVKNLKSWPIISKVGTHTYNTAKVTANCLEPLCQNEYKIEGTQSFLSMLKQQKPLSLREEYVLWDADSLFTNIPVDETNSYIINEIYQKNKLPQICNKTIFKRLPNKLTAISICLFNYN